MFDLALRKVKDTVLLPLAHVLARFASPNALTLAGLAWGLATAVLLGFDRTHLALATWIINRLLDGVDGLVARITKQQGDFGGYLDIMCDFIVYSVIPIGLGFRDPQPHTLLALSYMLAVFFVNSAGLFQLSALLEKKGAGAKARGESTSVTMPAGLIEGFETMVVYTLFILLPGYTFYSFLLFGSLVAFTILQRLYYASNLL